MRLRSSTPAALALFLAVPLPALAHLPNVTEKVEVTGQYENGVGTSEAASQGTVTAKLIENRPVLRAAEVLEFVPGVIVTQHSGEGKANQYFLRGFNLDHGTDFATWIDGMPVNMATHAHGQGYTDLNFLIPELVRRIDYLKGPYFASEGDFASAGAAHIALADRLPKSLAEITFGNRGYRRGVLAASPEISDGALLAAIELARNDGPWKNPDDFRKWSGLLRYSHASGAGSWSLTAMGYEAKWNSTDQIPQRAVATGALDRFGAIDPSDGGESARYSASFDFRRQGDASLFQASAYAIRSRLNLFSNFTYFLDDPVHGDQFQQSERRTVVGGKVSELWSAQLGTIELSHAIGLQARADRLDPVALYASEQRRRLSTTREDRIKQASAGVYYENSTHWTGWFRTLAGLRFDAYRFDVTSLAPENSGRVSSNLASPKLSAALGPWNNAEVFLNWGRGFHSNDARGTTATIDPKTREAVDRVTPLVRSTGSEIGLRVEPLTGLTSSLSLWQLRFASELLFVGDAGTTEPSRPSLRRGVEWNTHYAMAPKLFVDFLLAISRSRFTDEDPVGSRIPGSIERAASLGIAVDDIGPWSGSFQLRYFGPRPLIEDDSVRSGSTTIANARVSYGITKDVKVTLDAFNIFDRKANDIDYYYVSRLRGEPAAGIADIHSHPVEPRSMRLGITARF